MHNLFGFKAHVSIEDNHSSFKLIHSYYFERCYLRPPKLLSKPAFGLSSSNTIGML